MLYSSSKLAPIPSVSAHLASPIDELNARHPLTDGQVHFSRKVVQMSD